MSKAAYPCVRFQVAPGAVNPHGAKVYRPAVFATITASNGTSIRWMALVYTGADACLFPMNLALALKIDVFQLPKDMVGGVGSQANVTYYDDLTIDLGSGILFTCRAGFTQGLDAVGFGLLGKDGFFSMYDVEFSPQQKTLTVHLPE